MNPLLKAMITEGMDLEKVAEKVVAKDYPGALSALVPAGMDIQPIISNWPDLKPELEALVSNPAADADLLAFVGAKVAGLGAQAEKVILAIATLLLHLVPDTVALIEAFKPAAAPAPAGA